MFAYACSYFWLIDYRIIGDILLLTPAWKRQKNKKKVKQAGINTRTYKSKRLVSDDDDEIYLCHIFLPS